MTLRLDTRQRAMLQEMGIRIWSPAQRPAAPAAASAPLPPPVEHYDPAASAPSPAARAPAPRASQPQPAPATVEPGAVLHPPRALYPAADPQQTPAGLGACWLIVTEGLAHSDPLAGDPGRLLGNMLRALQLHRHPRVFLCALSTQPGTDAQAADVALKQAVARIQPSVLLLMGRAAARAVLQRSEPLGHLRGQAHWVAGIPCVVTYDAPYLLRAPHAKPDAWADLCLARTLAGASMDSR